MVEHFHKGHLETPLPKMNLSLIVGIGGHSEQKAKCHICFNAACWFVCVPRLIRLLLEVCRMN